MRCDNDVSSFWFCCCCNKKEPLLPELKSKKNISALAEVLHLSCFTAILEPNCVSFSSLLPTKV